MSPFQYRLSKVFELRERKKKDQERVVQKARERVKQIEQAIEAKKTEIKLVRQNMLTTSHLLYEAHDIFIQSLNKQLDELYENLKIAKEQLKYEMDLLVKYQADLEALVKHKEKALEEYQEEEKQREMKLMDEIAGQRYFRQKQQQQLDDDEDAAKLAELIALSEDQN